MGQSQSTNNYEEIEEEVKSRFILDGMVIVKDQKKLTDNITSAIIKLFNRGQVYLDPKKLEDVVPGISNNSMNLNFIIRHLVIIGIKKSRIHYDLRVINLNDILKIYRQIYYLEETIDDLEETTNS